MTPGDELEQALETMIDRHGLQFVISSIVKVCYGKADHVLVNWQDHTLAKAWDSAAKRLANVKLSVD